MTDFRCASTSVASAQSIDFTYSGQDDRVFTTSTWSDSTAAPLSTERASLSSASDESSTSESSSSSDTGTATPAPAPSGGGTNVGAIVGGTVGGVAVLALIGFGIFFMRRHSAKKDAQAGNQPAAPQTPHGTQPQQVQQYYPAPGASPAEAWKGGAGSPVHTNLTTPVNGAPYDDVSDIQSTRMSELHSPGPGQPAAVPGTIHEVDADARGHHRGGLHEMG